MMYNIYKFQEKDQNGVTFSLTSLTHFPSLTHSLTSLTTSRFACCFQEVEVVVEGTWLLGGDGFGTERARLAQGGSSAERARLAQDGFRGQFSKRNPFKRIF